MKTIAHARAALFVFLTAVTGCGEGSSSQGDGRRWAGRRLSLVSLARAEARCRCPEFSAFTDISICAAQFAVSEEVNQCFAQGWLAAGVSVSELECIVRSEEQHVGCYKRIEECDPDAVSGCDSARYASLGCSPVLESPLPEAYFLSSRACIESQVVGPATGCRPSSSSNQVGSAVFAGTVVGSGDDLRPSCAHASSADVELSWTAPANGRYRFDTNGGLGGISLAVFAGCGGPELACSVGNDASVNLSARAELDAVAGTTYLIVVEAQHESMIGPYQVNIARL